MEGKPLKKTTTSTLAAAALAALPRATIQAAAASRPLSMLLLAVTALWALPAAGANLFVANLAIGTIGEYNATTGTTVNASVVSGLSDPAGIAVSGANLFVANLGNGTIGEYNATTGATVNAALVSGLSNPIGIAVSGANLFVTNYGNGTIGEYNATTGATVNAALVSGLSNPYGITVVPEPSTWALLVTGGTALFLFGRARSKPRG